MILMHKPSDVPTLLLTPPWILVTPEQENIKYAEGHRGLQDQRPTGQD
jgi:hypothetical protein